MHVVRHGQPLDLVLTKAIIANPRWPGHTLAYLVVSLTFFLTAVVVSVGCVRAENHHAGMGGIGWGSGDPALYVAALVWRLFCGRRLHLLLMDAGRRWPALCLLVSFLHEGFSGRAEREGASTFGVGVLYLGDRGCRLQPVGLPKTAYGHSCFRSCGLTWGCGAGSWDWSQPSTWWLP